MHCKMVIPLNEGVGFICSRCVFFEEDINFKDTDVIKRHTMPQESSAITLRATALKLYNVFDYVGPLSSLHRVAVELAGFFSSNQVAKPCVVTYELGFAYSRPEIIELWLPDLIAYERHVHNISYGVFANDIENILKEARASSETKLLHSNLCFFDIVSLSFTVRPNRLAEIPNFSGLGGIKGGKYSDFPSFFDKSNNIINVKNKDEKCFLWSLLANDYLKFNSHKTKKEIPKRGTQPFLKIERNYFSTEFKRFFLGVQNINLYKKYHIY
jgi:hypothetical protein